MLGLRILTLVPRVTERDGVLRAQTSILLQVVTLGLARRMVVVDRRARYLTVDTRYLWLIRRKRVIPFRQIHRIEYDYERITTSIRRSYDGSAAVGDEVDSFHVALILRTRSDVPETHAHLYEERLPLFSFHGDGRGQTFSLEGQQEGLSRKFVDRLRELIGVGFGNELPQLSDEIGQRWSCERCKRPGPPRAGTCYYCGGALAPE